MKLSLYIEKAGLSRKEFADQSGVPLSTVYRLLDEPDVIPDGTNIARIVKATNGMVGVMDLVDGADDNGRTPAA
jgi:predicted transcriptional regulator